MPKIINFYDLKYYKVFLNEKDVSKFLFHQKCPICNSNLGFKTAIKLGYINWKNTLNLGVCKNCLSL